MVGVEISRDLLNKLDAKLKPSATWSLVFSGATGRFCVFSLRCYRLLVIFSFFLAGR